MTETNGISQQKYPGTIRCRWWYQKFWPVM